MSLLSSNQHLKKSLETAQKGQTFFPDSSDPSHVPRDQQSEKLPLNRSQTDRLDAEIGGLKKMVSNLESEKQKMATQFEATSLTLKSLKEKLHTAEQNLSYMFNRSKKMSDLVNEFMMFNYPDIYETSIETHTVNFDRLIQYVEFVLNECSTLRLRVGFFSPKHSSMNTSLVSTQKIRQFGFERSVSKEISPEKTAQQNISNKALTTPHKAKSPAVYQPTMNSYVTKKYKTETPTGISVFAKPQTHANRPSK